jgi:hypothetical protein
MSFLKRRERGVWGDPKSANLYIQAVLNYVRIMHIFYYLKKVAYNLSIS